MKTEIKRRKFGNTGLEVSELSLGAMNLRLLDTIDEAYELLNFVLDQGVNLIDTARAYNGENKSGQFVESEVLVGNTIRNRTDIDEPVIIVTKGHSYTPGDFYENLEISRSKLGIVDKLKIGNTEIRLVYFYHGISDERWEEIKSSGALEAAADAKKKGLISYIGFSSHYAFGKVIKEAIDTGIFDVIELPCNVFNRSLGEDGNIDLLKYAHDKGLGIINMKPFNGNGMNAIYRMIKDFITIDYKAMLNFCLSNPYISTVDAGARYVHEFREDIEVAKGERLTAEQLKALTQEADKISPHMNNICRECMHCMEKFECVKKIDFPGILAVYARYKIAKLLDKETRSFIEQYKNFTLNAETCIKCGKCKPWCEYKLDIPEMLVEAHEALSN